MKLPSQMRGLQLQRIGQLSEVTLAVPTPQPDEVLIRTVATTICTSDLNDLHHNPFGIQLPRVLGHEGAGVIAALGDNVRGFRIGDRVASHPVVPCRACSNCRRGLEHLCSEMGHLGLDRDGTFAEYYSLRSDRVRPVPANLELGVAALLEPVAVCVEALERARLQPDETVLIVGDGPFGIILARLARRFRPRRIILVGRHPFRLRQLPDAVTINQRITPDAAAAVQAAADGQGVDAAILAVGNQSALDLCVASARARGRVVVFSAIQGQSVIDLFKVHVKELSVLGACNDENHIDTALSRLADPELALQTLITHRLPFHQWPRAFDLAEQGKDSALKVALVFDENR
jgi:threonine dehydrogenase-like Zn-dependent dehydrogenase